MYVPKIATNLAIILIDDMEESLTNQKGRMQSVWNVWNDEDRKVSREYDAELGSPS
jgi:hypothetical protein